MSVELTDKKPEAQQEQPGSIFVIDPPRVTKDPTGRLTIETRQYEITKDGAGKIIGFRHVFDLNVVLGQHPMALENVQKTLAMIAAQLPAQLRPNDPGSITPAGPELLRALDQAQRQRGPRG